MKIYTKTGDAGETGLVGGARVGKDAPRVAAYGDVDELNAVLGAVLAEELPPAEVELLEAIQRDLFALGAQLADPEARIGQRKAKAALDGRTEALEAAIDEREAVLPPLQAFILPGGARAGALLHLARTVCRRAERSAVALGRSASIDPALVVYLNRLSDLLFVLARHVNRGAGRAETTW